MYILFVEGLMVSIIAKAFVGVDAGDDVVG